MHEPYDPSPEEIRMACEEIQATWTDHERYRRSAGRDQQAKIDSCRPASRFAEIEVRQSNENTNFPSGDWE